MIKKLVSILLLQFVLLSHGYSNKQEEGYIPLYSGTLLAFFAENIPPGQLMIEPYLFQTSQPGYYNQNWSSKKSKTINDLTLSVLFETGITSWLDISLYILGSYNQIGNLHTATYEDTQAYLGFQLLRDNKNSWSPDIRILLGESFPTGKYQHLNPKKQLSDNSGSGAYETFFIFVTRKIFYTFPQHPFNFNLNLGYTISTKTNVSGYNAYGGTYNTKGTISPGAFYMANLAMEYSLSRYFFLVIDIHYLHQNKSTFSGKKDSPPPVGLPPSEQISLAPCLEYNFNEFFGLLGGTWFTVSGRNSSRFISNIISVYYIF